MMHRDVIIMCDSVCDLPKDIVDKLGIHVVPLNVTVEDHSYRDGVDIKSEDIFNLYTKDGILPKTSAFSIGEIEEEYKRYTSTGKAVVHISLGSKLSSCYQNASIASDIDSEVFVIDSSQITSGIGIMVIEACKLRDEGYCARTIVHRLNELKDKIQTGFVIESLDYLCAGGRCSALTSMGANALRIRPSIEVRDGELKLGKRYRGKMEYVYRKFIDDNTDMSSIDTDYPVFITYAGVDDTKVEAVKQFAESKLGINNIITNSAGCTVSNHCGPGTLGIIYVRKYI